MKYLLRIITLLIPLYIQGNYILITSLYNEKNSTRAQEYITCLEKNIAHPDIKKIHVLYDVHNHDDHSIIYTALEKFNLTMSYIHGRPSYTFCLELANQLYPGERIIIANADIYFNETLALLNQHSLTRTVCALTRWDLTNNNTLVPYKFDRMQMIDSQDAWIFSTPFTGAIPDDIQLGTWRCDVRFAYYAQQAGYTVINPCKSIQCCHVHQSQLRSYHQLAKTTDPYFIRLKATTLDEAM